MSRSDAEYRIGPDASAWGRVLGLMLFAGVVLLPALGPELAWYMDNGPHLLDLRALAQGLAQGQRAVWSEHANLGDAPGLVNAPLAWLGAAGLHALGVPLLGAWLAGLVLSNGVATLGVYAFARRLWGEPAALVSGALAACSPLDLYGFSGAAAGMWPYRLATGVVLLGLGLGWGRWGVFRWGAWLALVIGLHSYAAVAAVMALLALLAWRVGEQDWEGAAAPLGGLLVGLCWTAWYWAGLGSLTRFDPDWDAGLWGSLVALPGVFSLGRWFFYRELALGLGGTALVWGLLVWGAGLLGLRRLGEARERSLVRVLVLGLLASLVAAFVVPSLGLHLAGPNPWRHLLWLRMGLVVLAGPVLIGGSSLFRVLGLSLGGALALGAGVVELNTPADQEVQASLRRAWHVAVEAAGEGVVYVQDSFYQPGGPRALERSHPLGALALQEPGRGLGSWYNVAPNAVLPWTASEGGLLFGVAAPEVRARPDWLYARVRVFGVGALVAVTGSLGDLLDADPRYRRLLREGQIGAWAVRQPSLEVAGLSEPQAELEVLQERAGELTLAVSADAPSWLRVRASAHPWWRGTLDGRTLPLRVEAGTGLLQAQLPRGGTVKLAWQSPGVLGIWGPPLALSLGALLGGVWLRSRWPGRLLLLGLLLHAILWWALRSAGVLIMDEGAYAMAVQAMLRGSLEVYNGYRELPSPTLELLAPGFSTQITAHAGRLVSQYPPGYTLLSAPFYALFGPTGILLMNGLAMLGVLALSADLARRWGARGTWVVLVLVGGTYLWEYSIAVLPHATHTAVFLAALSAASRAPEAQGARVWGWSLLAGALAGLALTVRLDTALCVPALAAAALGSGRERLRVALGAGLGASPFLMALTWANHERFGRWRLLDYGVQETDRAVYVTRTEGLGIYLGGVLVFGLVLILWGWLVKNPRWVRWVLVLGVIGVWTWEPLRMVVRGLYGIIVDLRVTPMMPNEPAQSRGLIGTIIYLGHFKKSLLQSMPWLGVLVVPLVQALREGPWSLPRRPALVLLLAWVLFFGAQGWHGGMALNLRYLVPALPAAAALGVVVMQRWEGHVRWSLLLPWGMGLCLAALMVWLVPRQPRVAEELSQRVPVLLGLVLAVLAWRSEQASQRGPLGAWALAAALGWAGGVAAFQDLALHRAARRFHEETGEKIAAIVQDNALILANYPDPLFPAKLEEQRIIASTFGAAMEEPWQLLQHHVQAGRPVWRLMQADRLEPWRQDAAAWGLTLGPGLDVAPWVLSPVVPVAP